jgi:hypothetical protein
MPSITRGRFSRGGTGMTVVGRVGGVGGGGVWHPLKPASIRTVAVNEKSDRREAAARGMKWFDCALTDYLVERFRFS